MVQSNVDGRSRTRRTKQSEEQAPLVESYLSSNSSTIYHGERGRHSTRLRRRIEQINMSGCLINLSHLQELFVLGLKEILFSCSFFFSIRTVHYK